MRKRRSEKNGTIVECITASQRSTNLDGAKGSASSRRVGRYRRDLPLFPRPLFLRRLSFQSHRDGGRRPKSFRERKTHEDDDGTVDRS